MANLYYDQGKYDRAIFEKSLGSEYPDTAVTREQK